MYFLSAEGSRAAQQSPQEKRVIESPPFAKQRRMRHPALEFSKNRQLPASAGFNHSICQSDFPTSRCLDLRGPRQARLWLAGVGSPDSVPPPPLNPPHPILACVSPTQLSSCCPCLAAHT